MGVAKADTNAGGELTTSAAGFAWDSAAPPFCFTYSWWMSVPPDFEQLVDKRLAKWFVRFVSLVKGPEEIR